MRNRRKLPQESLWPEAQYNVMSSPKRTDLKIKLVLYELVYVPAFALPMSSLLIRGLDSEPIQITGFIYLYVLDECLQLLQRKENRLEDVDTLAFVFY